MEVAKKGVEDPESNWAVAAGETSATFGDALRKLVDQSTYLYLHAVATGIQRKQVFLGWLRSARVRCRFMTCMKRDAASPAGAGEGARRLPASASLPIPTSVKCLMNPKRD